MLCRCLQRGITRAYFFVHQIFPFFCPDTKLLCLYRCLQSGITRAYCCSQRAAAGTQFPFFTGTKVQILTQRAATPVSHVRRALLVQKYKY